MLSHDAPVLDIRISFLMYLNKPCLTDTMSKLLTMFWKPFIHLLSISEMGHFLNRTL